VKNEAGVCMPKIYHWKNTFHSRGHELFGYIASSCINNEDADLFLPSTIKD